MRNIFIKFEQKFPVFLVLKKNKVQFYIVPDREIKVVIRGPPTSIEYEEIKENLIFKGFTVRNISQRKIAERRKMLSIFLIELHKNETSNESLI